MGAFSDIILISLLPVAMGFESFSIKWRRPTTVQNSPLKSSQLDEFFGKMFGNNGKDNLHKDGHDQEINLSSFQQELSKRQQQKQQQQQPVVVDESGNVTAINRKQKETDKNDATEAEVEEEFDGYAMRDAIFNKWGECFDVDFNRVDSYGFRSVYLNILPFRLGGKRFRHETELDYLCHLQAVVEILQKYNQLDYVLDQINETTKKPRAGTSPLVAVPLRLDLTEEQVKQILG